MKTVPRQFRLTENQNTVFEARVKASGMTINEYLRDLIAKDAATHGLNFPQDMPDNDIGKARAKRWSQE
jgi:hypothetical protein